MRGGGHGPVHTMLVRAARAKALRFHMPGHKGLIGLPGAELDLTELPDTDELFEPAGGILAAEEEAARCWNAGRSFLLVNGSTAGVQAMALWAAAQRRRLLLPRDCHISAVYACAIADLQPVWLDTAWSAGEQLSGWLPDGLRVKPPDGETALFFTYPDYYGRCVSLDSVAAQLSGSDASVLIDSAHGAHFVFSDRFPKDAGHSADAWVSGAHKTLPAPTQTAFLHVKDKRSAPGFARALRGVTTTSPSFTLLAGLDDSRVWMQNSRELLDELAENCLSLAGKINRLSGLRCWQDSDAKASGYAAQDPTRLVVDVRGLGMTGWEAGTRLRAIGVQAEMCDIYRVVLIATVMDSRERLDLLFKAFEQLHREKKPDPYACGANAIPKPGSVLMTLREAWLSKAVEIPLEDAAGRIAAEPFAAYPPGIPLCMPGEEITKDAVDMMRKAEALGGRCIGVRRGAVLVVQC